MYNFHSKKKETQWHNPQRFEEASNNTLLAKIDGNVSYVTTNHVSTSVITPVADVSGSLNNSYFTIYSSNNTKKVVVVFNVGGLGNLITPDGYDLRINVAINTNDNVETIIDALLTAITNASTSTHRLFTSITDNTTNLTLVNEANRNSIDVNTGFNFSVSEAQSSLEEYLVSEANTGKLVFKSAGEGLGDKHFAHTQSVASATWVVNHNLNKYPSVTVVDSAGTVVVGQVAYNSTTQATLTFVGSFSGKAYFN